jgi:hypothetical protein
MAVWYNLWSFVIFFTTWNVWTKKNVATLLLLINAATTGGAEGQGGHGAQDSGSEAGG